MSESIREPSYDTQDPSEWRDQIATYGYVVVHDVVPPKNLQAVIDDMWRHTGADPDDSESWRIIHEV